jgi:type IV secretion system protein VirB10
MSAPVDVLAPRRVSYPKVAIALVLLLGTIVGIWYVYAAQQAKPLIAQQKDGPIVKRSAVSNGIAQTPLVYTPPAKPPVEAVPAPEPGMIDGLMARIADLETRLAQRMTVAPATTTRSPATPRQPDPSVALRKKALAAAAKTPLVMVQTTAKADAVAERRTLQPGWKIPFAVETAVHSDIGSEFVARVNRTVYASADHTLALIPAGATLVGSAHAGSLVPGNERLPMTGVTLSIPGLQPVDLGAMPITDEQGQAGMVDEINKHYARMVAAIFLRGAMTGTSRIIQQEAEGAAGDLGEGLMSSTTQATAPRIQELYSLRPTIKVYRGSQGYVLVTKPVRIPAVPGGIE